MDEVGEAYRGVRTRVTELVRATGDGGLDASAPATPGWTARDVLAHLVGVTADITSGNLDGVGTDPWADAQVDARRGRDADALLAEWDEHGPVVEELAAGFGRAAGQLLGDATTHEHDLRGALGVPGARDSDAIAISVSYLCISLGEQLDGAGTGALRVQHADDTVTVGTGPVVASLHVDRFELLRAVTGRRCVEQLAAYDWDGTFAPEGLVLGRFTARPDPLVE